ncbi:hypothetical protein [Frateuria defendens]|uniref:hypothetical protein n=1 Tax=Frateuria defendens TaxID=2219559 RepID=UPI00129405B6|nr:hypothetical protein [Frateuria defendens]
MSTLWTDLLFLHGHVAPADLPWRRDAPVGERGHGAPARPAPIQQLIAPSSAAPRGGACEGGKPACA